jgi:hypothetical protein
MRGVGARRVRVFLFVSRLPQLPGVRLPPMQATQGGAGADPCVDRMTVLSSSHRVVSWSPRIVHFYFLSSLTLMQCMVRTGRGRGRSFIRRHQTRRVAMVTDVARREGGGVLRHAHTMKNVSSLG